MIVGNILHGADWTVSLKVATLLGLPPYPVTFPHTALGVVCNRVLVGGAVFHDFRGHDVEVTVAFEPGRWATPGTLRGLFAYPFTQLGCIRASALTAHDNKPARRLLVRLGARQEGFHPNKYGRDKHAVSYGLQAADCRWIRHAESTDAPAGS